MKYAMAGRIETIASSAVVQIKQEATVLEGQGGGLIYLLRGEPDFDTPVHICKAAASALHAGHTHYPPSNGIPELRQAISARVARDFGYGPSPDHEILVTSGATMGAYIALQAILNPGDEVILSDPSYDPYASAVRLAQGVPVLVPGNSGDGHFSFIPPQLETAVSTRTRAILFSNPWNPTGRVMTRAEAEQLLALAKRHDLLLIADEIYENIVFDDHQHLHLAALSDEARARTITINSFSKSYSMTGWRLGYNIAPPPLSQAMLRIAQQFSRSAATFVQYAGVAALEGSQSPVAAMRGEYSRRRQLIGRLMNEAGFTDYRPPEGTFFTLIDVRSLGHSDRQIARMLLEQVGVVTVPGSVYGKGGEGFLRLSFATDKVTLAQGVERLIHYIQTM